MKNSMLGLVFWVALSLAAGWFGSRFPPGDWYAGLTKPPWNPPNSVFAPVWSTLFVLMGVAAWLVWRRRWTPPARLGLGLFLVQLVLNGLWSYLFFGLHRPGAALVDIAALWLVILATLIAFWRVSRPAGALLLPYLAWVGFAGALNLQLWRLNP